AASTHQALLEGRVALRPEPVLGARGGDAVPLALLPGRALDETLPPQWLGHVSRLMQAVGDDGWGSARRPVIVTSSNFGVGNLYAYRIDGDTRHLAHGIPFASVAVLAQHLGWGANITIFSHACVTAHLGLLHASRLLAAGLADTALVVS